MIQCCDCEEFYQYMFILTPQLSSNQVSAVEQAMPGVSTSSACVLVLGNTQSNQSHVTHSRQLSRKHSVRAVFTDNLLLHDTRNHHDADLAAKILADVLHELNHTFAGVDDPVRKDDGIFPRP